MKKNFFKTINLFILIIIQLTSFSLCDDIENESIDVNSEIISENNLENKIKEPDINSRGCVIIDRNTNIILYGKNENTKRKMASTTKIMTAIIIIESCNLDETIEISKHAANTGGSRLGLKAGDKITINNLLYGLMLKSGNDAAVALAEYNSSNIESFANLMNKKALELHLTNTHFETPHGLDSDNHYTTPYELALLSNYALKNEIFSNIVRTKNYTITINNQSKNISNTNELLGNINGIYGIKTGFTNGANRCLVTACKRNNIDIICVVLGADTKKFRTLDSIKLINYIYNNFELINIKNLVLNDFEEWKNNEQKNIYINKGIEQKLELKLDNKNYNEIPIRKDKISSLSIVINYQKYFESPLSKNSLIGNIQVISNNKPLCDYQFYNTNTINKKTTYFYLLDLFKNYFTIIKNNII